MCVSVSVFIFAVGAEEMFLLVFLLAQGVFVCVCVCVCVCPCVFCRGCGGLAVWVRTGRSLACWFVGASPAKLSKKTPTVTKENKNNKRLRFSMRAGLCCGFVGDVHIQVQQSQISIARISTESPLEKKAVKAPEDTVSFPRRCTQRALRDTVQ